MDKSDISTSSPSPITFESLEESLFEVTILESYGSLKIPGEVLFELSSRFTANMPEEERYDLVRVCFQIELAHWFFIDYYCLPQSELFQMAHIPFNIFTYQMFDATPYLKTHCTQHEVDNLISEFRAYKNKVPVYGAILLTDDLSQVLLVQGFRNQWGFPKGKVNKNENEVDCAIREVLEETGYDIRELIEPQFYIETVHNERITRLYIVIGADREFQYHPQTAYEIKTIGWFDIEELPENRKDTTNVPREGCTNSNFFTVFPYTRRLKIWIYDKIEGYWQYDNFPCSSKIKRPDPSTFNENYSERPIIEPLTCPLLLPPKSKHQAKKEMRKNSSALRKLFAQEAEDKRILRENKTMEKENSQNITPKNTIKITPERGELHQKETKNDDNVKRLSLSELLNCGKTPPKKIREKSGLNENKSPKNVILTSFNERSKKIEKDKRGVSNFFEGKGPDSWLNFKLDVDKFIAILLDKDY